MGKCVLHRVHSQDCREWAKQIQRCFLRTANGVLDRPILWGDLWERIVPYIIGGERTRGSPAGRLLVHRRGSLDRADRFEKTASHYPAIVATAATVLWIR